MNATKNEMHKFSKSHTHKWRNQTMTTAQGRNGQMKCKGLILTVSDYDKTVMVHPITGKDTIGNARLEIPQNELSVIIEMLKNIRSGLKQDAGSMSKKWSVCRTSGKKLTKQESGINRECQARFFMTYHEAVHFIGNLKAICPSDVQNGHFTIDGPELTDKIAATVR